MRNRKRKGFALLLVFAMMSAAAVMIYLQLPRFVMEAQRSKEQLLIDRGEQYQRAIQLYYRKMKTWPQSLDDLEKGNNTRYLRRKYVDPFTGKADWRLVHVANGIYTDSLVYNTKEEQKGPKPQTFVAELPSVGTNGAADNQGPDNANSALRVHASDRTKDPLDELPEALRAFVYRGSIAAPGERPVRNPDEDVQYSNGAQAPTAGVYGMRGVDLGGLTGAQILAGGSGNVQNGANNGAAPSPVPGANGMTFEEIQRQLAAQQAAAAGTNPLPFGGTGGGFVGQAPPPTDPYNQSPVPGAAGLPFSAIAQPNGNYTGVTGVPPIPGTVTPGFPTGINPAAPPFGQPPAPTNAGGGFIGGGFIGGSAPTAANSAANTFGQQGPGQGFGNPGFGQQPGLQPGQQPGFGNPGGGAAPAGFGNPGAGGQQSSAASLLNDAIFGPRPAGSAGPAGTAAGGSGLAGVASKYKGATVKVYREKSKFQLWEFIYDPAKEVKAGQAGQQKPPLPGGLPSGTLNAPQPAVAFPTGGSFPGQTAPPIAPGTTIRNGDGIIGGGGFSSTTPSGGGGFIGGAPVTLPPPTTFPGTPGATPGTTPGTTPQLPVQPTTPPPSSGGGGFISGK